MVVHRVPTRLQLVRVCQACHTAEEDIVSKPNAEQMEVRGVVVARRVLLHQKASSAAVEAYPVFWGRSEGQDIL